MTDKRYNLDYFLQVQGRDGTIYTIEGIDNNSLVIEYEVVKTYTNQTNTGNITIYNLSQEIRNNLKKTKLDTDIRQLNLSLGFNGNFTNIFRGTVKECSSNRQGENFKTQINGWDGGEAILKSQSNLTLNNNVDIYKRLSSDLKGVTIGYISDKAKYKLNTSRGQVLSGKTWDILKRYQGEFQMFIDNQQLYIMAENETLNYTYNIKTENGILETPKDLNGTIQLNLLGEVNFRLKGIVNLELEDDKTYNGKYIIIKITQRGTIAKIGGRNEWTTTLELQKNLYNQF